MIPDVIIGLVVGMLRGVLGLVPEWSVPAEITSVAWVDNLLSALAVANTFVPLVDIGIALGILVGFQLVILVVQGVVWLYDRIPFKAT